MTDKQIIIDGVPVQDCCYFDYENDGYEDSCYIHQNECSAQNCYYKQLKRKEQECEELKEELHQNFKEKDGLHLIIDRLLEASGCDINTTSAEDFEDVYENMRYEKQQLDQLKQILAEIKEIAENAAKCLYATKSDDYTDGYRWLSNKILQKISEVENDNK